MEIVRWIGAFTPILFLGCRESPHGPAPSSSPSATRVADAGGPELPDASVAYDEYKVPWLEMGTAYAPWCPYTFAIDDDGTASFVDRCAEDRPVAWRGRLDKAKVQSVEDVLRKNRFCDIPDEPETQYLKQRLDISLHGASCSVTLSIASWKKKPRALASFRALRDLIAETCGAECRSLPMLSAK